MCVKASETVSHEIEDGVGLIELDNPPVNAASHDLRNGVVEAMKALEADGSVRVIAIYGVGRAFIAGADIREFGKPLRDPPLPDVCLVLENCRKTRGRRDARPNIGRWLGGGPIGTCPCGASGPADRVS